MAPAMSMSMSCAGCLHAIEHRRFLKCSLCSEHFDLLCANVSEKRFFNTMTSEHRENWKCQGCVVKLRDGTSKKEATPVAAAIVTTRSRSRNNGQSTPPPPSQAATEAVASSQLVDEIRLLREELKVARTEIQGFSSAISGLTAAVNMCNLRIDDLSARVEAIERKQLEVQGPANDVSMLEQTVAQLQLDLNDRDQEMLSNDIEMAGVPEENNERSLHLVLSLSSKLGVALEESDVVSAERVGGLRVAREGPPQPARPRPLVVRLARRAPRDQLLAAARVRRSATTEGVTTAINTFYVNERLTKHNRLLFYKARAEATAAQWKYVWTRDGSIYTRKEHGAPRHRLRSDADLNKVFAS